MIYKHKDRPHREINSDYRWTETSRLAPLRKQHELMYVDERRVELRAN